MEHGATQDNDVTMLFITNKPFDIFYTFEVKIRSDITGGKVQCGVCEVACRSFLACRLGRPQVSASPFRRQRLRYFLS